MKYILAGFGRFGHLAFDRLRKEFPDREIVVLEKASHRPGTTRCGAGELYSGDAVSFLVEETSIADEDLVIPMVPFNLAAAYLLALHPELSPVRLPPDAENMVPNPVRLDDSNLCCSHADFTCPDDCPEGDRCTVTGEPRDTPLYRILEGLDASGFEVRVQRSSQILPGVGGYTMGELRRVARPLTGDRCLMATSCKCHGIITSIGIVR